MHPAYFAVVMATGIVSVAIELLGGHPVAVVLFALNVPLYLTIWGLTVARIVRHPQKVSADLHHHGRSVGFFTAVPSTSVLGSQFLLIGGNVPAAAALWGRSGNGCWILVRLPDYPNDPAHRTLVAEAVKAVSRRYSDPEVVIDTATVNPARLMGLPGTIKAKGSPRPERPWRPVTLDGMGRGLGGRCVGPPADGGGSGLPG